MNILLENSEGVHLQSPFDDHTICGDTLDGDDNYMVEEIEPMWATDKKVVTCPRCILMIKTCRGVRYRERSQESV